MNEKIPEKGISKTILDLSPTLYLTRRGCVELTVFPDDALQRAAQYIKNKSWITDAYRYVYKMCNQYCQEKGIKLNYQLRNRLMEEQMISESEPCTHHGKEATFKSMGEIHPELDNHIVMEASRGKTVQLKEASPYSYDSIAQSVAERRFYYRDPNRKPDSPGTFQPTFDMRDKHTIPDLIAEGDRLIDLLTNRQHLANIVASKGQITPATNLLFVQNSFWGLAKEWEEILREQRGLQPRNPWINRRKQRTIDDIVADGDSWTILEHDEQFIAHCKRWGITDLIGRKLRDLRNKLGEEYARVFQRQQEIRRIGFFGQEKNRRRGY